MSDRLIYFLRPVGQRGQVKIGCSAKPAHRLAMLLPWSPLELEVVATAPGDFSLEKRLHSLFRGQFLRHEWFDASDALDAVIEGVQAGRPLEHLIDMKAPIVPHRPRRRRTPEECRWMSYAHRLWHAFHGIPFVEPYDVRDIMERWKGDRYREIAPILPTDAEVARIEEVLAKPKKHGRPFRKLSLMRRPDVFGQPPKQKRRAA